MRKLFIHVEEGEHYTDEPLFLVAVDADGSEAGDAYPLKPHDRVYVESGPDPVEQREPLRKEVERLQGTHREGEAMIVKVFYYYCPRCGDRLKTRSASHPWCDKCDVRYRLNFESEEKPADSQGEG